jgi:hypothetical protein
MSFLCFCSIRVISQYFERLLRPFSKEVNRPLRIDLCRYPTSPNLAFVADKALRKVFLVAISCSATAGPADEPFALRLRIIVLAALHRSVLAAIDRQIGPNQAQKTRNHVKTVISGETLG